LPRGGLGRRDQICNRLDRAVLAHRNHERLIAIDRDHLEVVERVELQRLVDRGRDRVPASERDQRVAVGLGLGEPPRRGVAAGAGSRLDDDGLAQPRAQCIADDARHHVAVAAGGETMREQHRPDRVGILPDDARGAGGEHEQSDHGLPAAIRFERLMVVPRRATP
jgi:hypothetical protein